MKKEEGSLSSVDQDLTEVKMETESLHAMYVCLYMNMCVCTLVYVNIYMHELCTYMCRYAFMYKPLQGIMRWQSQAVGLPLCSLKGTLKK